MTPHRHNRANSYFSSLSFGDACTVGLTERKARVEDVLGTLVAAGVARRADEGVGYFLPR